jgi:hypothetical protein
MGCVLPEGWGASSVEERRLGDGTLFPSELVPKGTPPMYSDLARLTLALAVIVLSVLLLSQRHEEN